MIKRILRKFGFFPREWVGSVRYLEGETLVEIHSGRVVGHIYPGRRTEMIATDCLGGVYGVYTTRESAKRAVEARL